MSASSKKKLRKEQNAELLTERQRREKAEAKKLRRNTIIFVVCMALVVSIALGTVAVRAVNQSGIIDRNTLAAIVGDHELNSVELSYFYNDAVTNMYNQWYSSYQNYTATYVKMLYGLDLTKPLDKQIQNTEKNTTWADYFVSIALDDAKSTYALYDKAVSEGFKVPEEDLKEMEDTLSSTDTLAKMYGYKTADDYLRAYYGYGSDLESYSKYMNVLTTVYAYRNSYLDSLKYTDADLREHEKEHYNDYSAFSYDYYYLSYTSFLPTKSESDADTSYTDAEKEAARAKVKEVAESLAKATSAEDFDKLIKALEINKDKTDAASTKSDRTLYSSVNSVMRDWLSSKDRKAGDMTAIASTTTNKTEDGKDETLVTGYYVVLYRDVDTNDRPIANVRHLLVKFSGGTKDEDGHIVYSDAEKAAAKEKAEGYLKTWKEGKADEDSFIELVKKHSDDSSASTGGLFEGITPESNYVENFLNWSIDPGRKAGDTEVIETEYGYHVMYYVDAEELSYRDTMITDDLKSADFEKWHESIVKDVTITGKDTSRLDRDKVLSSGSTY